MSVERQGEENGMEDREDQSTDGATPADGGGRGGEASRSPRTEAFRILFVCTGNTCRSPMAEVIARREIEERGWRHVEVVSAGVSAFPGVPASREAVAVAEANDLDLSGHESTSLTAELVADADLVLVMADHHLDAVGRLGGEEKGTLLSVFSSGDEETAEGGWSVPDPVGGTREEYEETFRTLEGLVADALRRLEPIVAP